MINIGIIWLLVRFHRNTHTIQDPQAINNPLLSLTSLKMFLTFFTGPILGFITILLPWQKINNMYFIHLQSLIALCIAIFITRSYIKQNSNLKLYVSIYHLHPPPVLPWQLPENFNPDTVKLVVIKHKRE